MDAYEILDFLKRIDNGYVPTEKEKCFLSEIKEISWRTITQVPVSITLLTGIRVLNLSYSKIQKLPSEIGQLNNLTFLKLNFVKIRELPPEISQLTNLKTLQLSSTLISELPVGIGNLKNLENLYLNSTSIRELPPEISQLTNLETLQLDSTLICELPVGIGNLINLENLQLNSTNISELPTEIGYLTKLNSLTLRETHIKKLPPEISQLTNLKSLDLRATQISELPEIIGCLINLENLNLRSTHIRKLPMKIGELTKLKNLDLRSTQIKELPAEIGLLVNLESLDLRYTQIRELPVEIGHLINLESVDLRSTQIRELPAEVGRLTKLKYLYLSPTQIRKLPAEIGQLINLTNLNLSSTQIKKLPKEIGQLINLESLDLSNTQLSDLPQEICYLKNLKNLNLRSTQIKELPVGIGQLKKLKKLFLNFTQITQLPVEICELTNLECLDLSFTQISILPTEIGQLTNLESLDLRSTKISDLSTQIGQLTKLKKLYLFSTQISELPETIDQLISLESLDLSSTQIRELPKNLDKLIGLRILCLMGLTLPNLPSFLLKLGVGYNVKNSYGDYISNPGIYILGLKLLQQPVSLFSQPRELIEDYYRQPHTKINESKVIFLGSEGVGKTHTIKRIFNENHKISENLMETPGISITSKTFETESFSYRIVFWDFGGQEIMHAMHRCFLTDRTGYVVVVSTRFGDVNKQARYWLRSIESFTKDAPVVIFVNTWSDGTFYLIDEYSLRRDYPNIIDIKQCSAKDGSDEDFSNVVSAIQKMALSNDSISMSFPENWEKVRQDIIKLGREGYGQFYISLHEYRKKCRENGIENEDIQTWLLEWFNDLGECFSYNFEEKHLEPDQDYKVLNPEWLTNAIYIIIREARDLATNGIIAHKGVRNKLDHSDKGTLEGVSYSEDECSYVLEVMRKFKLSYKIPGADTEFIPALLSNKTPSDLEDGNDAKAVISYEMRYKYLPENIIHNLMIQMYQYLDIERCWRKGMVIDARRIFDSGLYAVLDMSRGDDILRIKVFAYADYAPWQLLQEIRSRLLEINSRMNLVAEDYILVDTLVGEYVSIEKLIKLKKRGIDFLQGEENNYDINLILGETFGDEQALRIDKFRNKNYKAAGKTINQKNEPNLSVMEEALIQAEEERLFSSTSGNRISFQTVCEAILSACEQIQANPLYWNQKEDSRSMQVRTILRNRGYFVSDQTLHGHAPDSTNPGEIDLMVMENPADPLTIIEAMNISFVDKKYIYNHLIKLMDYYNPSGIRELFLVIYVQKEKSNFQYFWKSYCTFINGTDVEKFKFVRIQEVNTGGYYLKHAITEYDCGSAVYIIHHICMRAGD